MAKSAQNRDEIRKKHNLRAIQLAKILFEDEGYFIDYLIEIEELVKNTYHGEEGRAVQTRTHRNFTKPIKDQS